MNLSSRLNKFKHPCTGTAWTGVIPSSLVQRSDSLKFWEGSTKRRVAAFPSPKKGKKTPLKACSKLIQSSFTPVFNICILWSWNPQLVLNIRVAESPSSKPLGLLLKATLPVAPYH